MRKEGGYTRSERPLCLCGAPTKAGVTEKGGRVFRCARARFDAGTGERKLEPDGRPTGCVFRRALHYQTDRPGQPAFKAGFEPPPEKPKAAPPSTTGKNGVAGACTCASTCAQAHHCPCNRAGKSCTPRCVGANGVLHTVDDAACCNTAAGAARKKVAAAAAKAAKAAAQQATMRS